MSTMAQTVSPKSLRLVLFGDQTCNISDPLRDLLLQSTRSAAQRDFVRDAGVCIRTQLAQLQSSQRDRMPAFSSIHDMLEVYARDHRRCHPVVSSVLHCVTQILQVFRHFECRNKHNRDTQTAVVGLCSGSLAAALYATAQTLSDVKVLAVPTVSLAFHVGLQAELASSMLHRHTDLSSSWSASISNISETEATAMINDDSNAPLQHRCYISAVALKSITVSGTPTALARLSNKLAGSQPSRRLTLLPITAAYHSGHIHSSVDCEQALERSDFPHAAISTFSPAHIMLSSSTGDPIAADGAIDLFRAAVEDTLQQPLRLDRILDQLLSSVDVQNLDEVVLDFLSPAPIAEALSSALRSRTSVKVSNHTFDGSSSGADPYEPLASHGNAPLAIVGMSGRFPDADTTDALWQLLSSGTDAHKVIPKDRFDADRHVDPESKTKNTSWTPYGCFIDRPGEFDPRFFNMSPKEALQTDPMQRLALVTAYEALEQAGFVPDRTRSSASDRVGTFYGQTSDDYRDVNSAQDIGTYFITGGIRAFGPGRINYFFQFSGPSYSVDTACSSSLAAIQLACTAIWNSECDTAVTGGLSVLTSPDLFAGLSRGQFLSKTGSCKTFDDSADGYCRADGIGTVVIKRLSDAEADRDNVLAVILSAATNHSAEAVSITHPHAETQSTLYRHVLQQAGVKPHDVGYVEMHGTGTQAGDGTEVRSVTDVFAPAQPRRPENNPLFIGAVKANIGHGEASSGVVSLIKAMLILKHSQIPAHVGIKGSINHGFPDLQARNVRIAHEMTPFERDSDRKRTILVNNFSAAGGNTALLIQEPPPVSITPNGHPRPAYPVTVSGHTTTALTKNLERLVQHLAVNTTTSLLDLSYTTTARRRHHAYRITVTEGSIERVMASLERQKLAMTSSKRPKMPDVVFVFTGQGASYPSLAFDLFESCASFKADIIRFDALNRQQGFPSFLPLIDGTAKQLSELSPTQTQVGLACIQIALVRLWQSLGVKPAAVVGHSLGEYAAMQVAGVLSISDMIFLVGARAQLLEKSCEQETHSMLAVGELQDVVETAAAQFLSDIDIACINGPREIVYAGPTNAVNELGQRLKDQGIRCTTISVPYAFHSAQVDVVLDDFASVAADITFAPPTIPVISAAAGQVLSDSDPIDSSYFVRHCRQKVQFSDALLDAKRGGLITDTTHLLEVGPHPICTTMARSALGTETLTLPTLRRKESAWTTVGSTLAALHDAGVRINWSEYFHDLEKSCRLLSLPAYAFDNRNYWIDYRHDWTLRKGDPLPSTDIVPEADRSAATRPTMISSSLHRVVREDYGAEKPHVVFETDLAHPHMHTAISGHSVNGSALCPSSLYADIALTVARYVQDHGAADFPHASHDISDMEVHQPLIISSRRDEEKKTLKVIANLDRSHRCIHLEYRSTTPSQISDVKHATCLITFDNGEKWLQRWSSDLHLVQERISHLEALSTSGDIDKITNRLAYRLFASLVDYAPQYRRMGQIAIDSQGNEATARIAMSDDGIDGSFDFSPYHLDGLLHLSGFIMNGSDTGDNAVYISHGWEGLRIAKPLRYEGDYQVYVKMLPRGKNMVAGNVYMLCGGEIVGFCEEIRFQRVPRSVLDMLLPPVSSKRTIGRQQSLSAPIVTRPQTVTAQKPEASNKTNLKSSHDSLQIIADEIGMSSSELSEDDSLEDLGVDSLMSLSLAGKLTSQLSIDINHTELMRCSSVKSLLELLRLKQGGDTSQTLVTDGRRSSDSSESVSSESTQASTSASTPVVSSTTDRMSIVYSIILEETGLDSEDLDHHTDLADHGMDSLMNLTVLSRLRDAGIDLPAMFFTQHRTMQDINAALSPTLDPKDLGDRLKQSAEAVESTSGDRGLTTDSSAWTASVILLQRTPAATANLFLFPDGSGSPSAYAGLPRVHPSFNVYGLVCPFVNRPSAYDCGLEKATSIYLRSVMKHQPEGPYHLAGWSVGGVLAFEAARQLVDIHGKKVGSLTLIDAPCPLTLPPMNTKLIDFLNSRGVFAAADGRQTSSAKQELLLQHFNATVNNLGQYKPLPLSADQLPDKVLVLWARDGVYDNDDAAKQAGLYEDPIAAWILNNRKDPGLHGWQLLLGEDRTEVELLDGNHFSLMAQPNIQNLSRSIQRHLGGHTED